MSPAAVSGLFLWSNKNLVQFFSARLAGQGLGRRTASAYPNFYDLRSPRGPALPAMTRVSRKAHPRPWQRPPRPGCGGRAGRSSAPGSAAAAAGRRPLCVRLRAAAQRLLLSPAGVRHPAVSLGSAAREISHQVAFFFFSYFFFLPPSRFRFN